MHPLLIAAAAGGLYALTRGPKTPPPGAPAADWHDAIADATASGDPKRMLDLARKLDAEGYTQAAQDLRDQAAALGSMPPGKSPSTTRRSAGGSKLPRAGAGTGSGTAFKPVTPTARRLPEPPPKTPPTTSVPSPPPNVPDNGLEQAVAVAKMLAPSGPWKESSTLKDLVRAFQSAHGLTSDGYYGPVMARHIAAFNIVPPTPFYWPNESTRTVQAAYKQFLTDKAAEDPAQAMQWLAAAKRVVF